MTLFTVSALPTSAEEKHPRFCLVTKDVTERIRLRQRAEMAERMASIGRLAAGVAHEANNPLAYVLSNLHFAVDEFEKATPDNLMQLLPEALQALREAREGGERVRVVVRDLYSLASADAETRGFVDLRSTLERSIAMARPTTRIRAHVQARLGETPPIIGNEAKLGQVFLNLLVNAAQSRPEELPGPIEVQVVSGTLPDGRAYVDVRDTGLGIPPEHVSRIFDPFFTTKPPGQGMGLGLSICQTIIVAHGGELTLVESVPGRGTTFRVALPAASG